MALPRLYRNIVPKRIRELVRSVGGDDLIEEVHVECLDQSLPTLLRWCQKNAQARLMLTPKHPELAEYLLRHTENPVGLHLHRDLWSLTEGDDFMTNQLLEPTQHIAAGHWRYDWEFLEECQRHGYLFIHVKCSLIHEYQEGIPSGLILVPVHRHLHDYDILGVPPVLR